MRYTALLKLLPLISGVVIAASSIPTTAEAAAKCHCRSSVGERIQVGNFTCIKTNEGLKEARCEYVLNNTSWKFTGKGCPFTHYQPNKSAQPYSTATIDFKKLGLKHNPLQ